MTCPFKRCQDQVTHCDGACHGVMPDGSPMTDIPALRDDLVTVQILRADRPNSNNRVYPMAALKRCIEKAEAGPVYGSLGLTQGTVVELGAVSHIVEDLRLQDGYLVGKVRVLATPKGLELLKVIEHCKFRPTGTGIIREGLVTDYNLISIDAV